MVKKFIFLLLAALACAARASDASAPVQAGSAPVDTLAVCRLPEMKVLGDVGLGFPRLPFRLKTLGEVRFKVLFIDFSDAPATRTPQQVFSIIMPKAADFYSAVSYGKMRLIVEPTYRWLRMSKTSSGYHFGRGAPFDVQHDYLQEAIDRAGALDYARTDAILVVANPEAKAIDWGPTFAALPGRGVIAGGREIVNGATSGSDLPILGWRWFTHEIGHAMSLVDLAGPLPQNGLWHTYVGQFSAMGEPTGAAPEYLAWERWQLGWIDDAQVVCAAPDTRGATLTPIERAGGTKMLIVPTGPTTAVAVESRRAEGFDQRLPKPGPLVYTIDTRLSTHSGAIRVQPPSDTDERHLDAPMSLGQTMTVTGVTITFTASDAQGDTLQLATRPAYGAGAPALK